MKVEFKKSEGLFPVAEYLKEHPEIDVFAIVYHETKDLITLIDTDF